jgi:hypothetical protein
MEGREKNNMVREEKVRKKKRKKTKKEKRCNSRINNKGE